jgi:hypothetical protein
LVRVEGKLDNTALNCGPNRDRANINSASDWEARKKVPRRPSAEHFDELAPMSWLLFDKGPFRLFDERRKWTSVQIDQMMRLGEEERLVLREELNGHPILSDLSKVDGWRVEQDSVRLVHRSDLLAMFTLLSRVRKAEAKGDLFDHFAQTFHLFSCLPGLGRFPWLRKDFGLICRLVELVVARMPLTARFLEIDWNVLNGQFFDPNFEPDPRKRSVDPETGEPISTAPVGRLVRPRTIGRPVAWPPEPKGDAIDSAAEGSLSFSDVQRLGTEWMLFASFMWTALVWGLERKDWEACLSTQHLEVETWLTFGTHNLSQRTTDRLILINHIREDLSNNVDYRTHPSAFMRKPREDLLGAAALDLIAIGDVGRVREFVDLVPKDYTPAKPRPEIVPLVSI